MDTLPFGQVRLVLIFVLVLIHGIFVLTHVIVVMFLLVLVVLIYITGIMLMLISQCDGHGSIELGSA